MTRTRAVLCLSLLVLAASIVTELSFADGPPDLSALAGVNFVSGCGFSHRASSDPIVYPGWPGVSHNHTFVGNTSTNAFSTLKSLLRHPTTCKRPGDTAAYWMPTVSVGYQIVTPRTVNVYYRRTTLASVRAFPPGLEVVAGDAHATAPQSKKITFWNCGPNAGVPNTSEVPTCPDDRQNSLRLHVNFPDCWDGVNLDSPDHKMHMAYSTAGKCPSTHPVAVPAINLIYVYPIAGSPSATLASGGQYTGHGDFFNAWDQATLQSLVDGCLNALRHCQNGS